MIEVSRPEPQRFKRAKSAKDFKLNELNISKSIKSVAKKYINGDNGHSIDELLLIGRITAYRTKYGIQSVDGDVEWRNVEAWKVELTKALDDAGYIRHDLTPTDIGIARFYNALFGFNIAPMINWSFDIKSNREYERLVHVSEDRYADIKNLLEDTLSEEEYQNICNDFGFGLVEEKKCFAYYIKNVSQANIDELREKMPRIYAVNSDKHEAEIDNLINKLNELHENSLFNKEAALRKKLSAYVNLPFTCAEKARKHLLKYNLDSISSLDLDEHIIKCLLRSGITTISDLVTLTDARLEIIRFLKPEERDALRQLLKTL